MATLAILLKDGQHVFVESDGWRGTLTGRGRRCPEEGTRQDEQQEDADSGNPGLDDLLRFEESGRPCDSEEF
jgi:hypothetical protein